MAKTKQAGKAKPKSALWWIGMWATIWWGLSGVYVLAFVVAAKDFFIDNYSARATFSNYPLWSNTYDQTLTQYPILTTLFYMIIIGWIVGGAVWLAALKQAKISYRDGLKDLFGTLRW